MRSLGKQRVTAEAFDKEGKSLIAIANEVVVYERANGTHFIRDEGRRLNVAAQPGGGFYVAVGGSV